MGTIETAQFHVLPGLDFVGEHGATHRPVGAAHGEIVFDHPLHKVLGHHRPGVLEANLRGDAGSVSIGGGGRDAIHHGAWERHLVVDPVAQFSIDGVRKSHHCRFGALAVAGQVVTTEDGKGRNTRRLSVLQGRHDQTENGFGRTGIGKIGLDRRCLKLECATGGVQVIALFCHRHADDTGAGQAHDVKQLTVVVFTTEHIQNRANDLHLVARGPHHRQRIQAILWLQGIFHAR